MMQTTADQREWRRGIVADMAIAGMTERQIVDALRDRFGLTVSKTTVHRDLVKIRADWAERRSASYDRWVSEIVALLDAARKRVMPQVMNGSLRAVDRLLAIVDRYCRILGLNAPTEVKLTESFLDSEIARMAAELGEEADEILRRAGLDPSDFQ